jgi:hypothetical protein
MHLAKRQIVNDFFKLLYMILKTNFNERLFRPVGTKVGQKSIILVPELNIIRNPRFSLHFNQIDKFIWIQYLVFIILLSFAMENLNLNQKQYASKI